MASEHWLSYVTLVLALYQQIYAGVTEDPSGIVLPIINFWPSKKIGFSLNFTGKALIINVLVIKSSAAAADNTTTAE